MIEAALERPSTLEVAAFYEVRQVNRQDRLHLVVEVTNRGDRALTYDDVPSVHGILYEDVRVRDTGRFARSSAQVDVENDLLPGETASYELDLELPRGVQLRRSHVLALVDVRPPDRGGAYELAQAAIAVEGLPTPTAVATATAEPTPTPVMTATPSPTATATAPPEATATPADLPPSPTAKAARRGIYLPLTQANAPR
jgi:cell division septation protein DedD